MTAKPTFLLSVGFKIYLTTSVVFGDGKNKTFYCFREHPVTLGSRVTKERQEKTVAKAKRVPKVRPEMRASRALPALLVPQGLPEKAENPELMLR